MKPHVLEGASNGVATVQTPKFGTNCIVAFALDAVTLDVVRERDPQDRLDRGSRRRSRRVIADISAAIIPIAASVASRFVVLSVHTVLCALARRSP